MKKALCLFSLLFPLVASADPSSVPGRFQLYSANIEVMTGSGQAETDPAVFKLDTVTGQTWYFVFYSNSATNAPKVGWLELTNIGQLGSPISSPPTSKP